MTPHRTPPHKVLIANRGEIALRIIRACRDLGLPSVAIYADPDADALHVRMANEAHALPGSRPADTYLNIERIIQIARQCKATMIHPGYGFLSERAEFASAVTKAGLIWIGPNADTIRKLGDKVQARKIAKAVGAPLVTGTDGPVSGVEEVLEFANTHGLPIAIKAAFGGGGRGLKIAWRHEEIAELYHSAVREAKAAFGRGECYVEQFLDCPRHIEAQIIADQQGHTLVLGTRDCSLQRRNQKLIEEAPAPFISDARRQQIHDAAKNICAHVGYTGAGTVEFLLARNGTLSFLEVNTRLQVEHPVTEETSGIDLVVEQLRIAQGLPLSLTDSPAPRGHAIEFRINAEDPAKGFLPTPGDITLFQPPTGIGVRLDSGVISGSQISGHYDSLMAKLIITADTRQQAIARARRALSEFTIEGVASVLPFHRAVLESPDFTEQFRVHTRWIETEFNAPLLPAPRQLPPSEAPLTRCWIEINGQRMQLGLPASLVAGLSQSAHPQTASTPPAPSPAPSQNADSPTITAPVSGLLHLWQAPDGAQVRQGDPIAVMEAMKMEVPILAPCTGVLIHQAATGESLAAGQKLGEIQPVNKS